MIFEFFGGFEKGENQGIRSSITQIEEGGMGAERIESRNSNGM